MTCQLLRKSIRVVFNTFKTKGILVISQKGIFICFEPKYLHSPLSFLSLGFGLGIALPSLFFHASSSLSFPLSFSTPSIHGKALSQDLFRYHNHMKFGLSCLSLLLHQSSLNLHLSWVWFMMKELRFWLLGHGSLVWMVIALLSLH
jgi:hypothetical protein